MCVAVCVAVYVAAFFAVCVAAHLRVSHLLNCVCVRDMYSDSMNSWHLDRWIVESVNFMWQKCFRSVSPRPHRYWVRDICVRGIYLSATNSIPTGTLGCAVETLSKEWEIFAFVTYTHLPRTQYLYYQRNESSIWRSFAFVTFRMTLICVRDIYSSATNSMSHLNINSTSHLHRRRRLNFK